MAAAVSGDTQNADDVDKEKPNVELHRESDAICAVIDYKMMSIIIRSIGSDIENSEQSCAPSEIEEFWEAYEEDEGQEAEEKEEEAEEKKEEEEDGEEDIQDVCEKDEQGFSPLYFAVEHRDTEAVRNLLISSVDVTVLDANKNIPSQLYPTIKRLLIKNASVDPRNAFDQASVRMASENNHFGMALALVENDADANIRSDSYNASLLVAAEMGYAEIVKALVDYDGEVNAVDENGETFLHLAARNDLNAIVKVLLNQSTERDARTLFKHAENQDLPVEFELTQEAIRNKASQIPHLIATKGGKTVYTGQSKPLHANITAGRGNIEIVENLILKGANVNACNKDKMTPLHLACENGLSSIVEILLDNHATVDVMKQAQETPFYLAAENGQADVVDVLLRRGICDFVTINWNDTPLHVAANKRHTKVVEVIMKHSCRIYGKFIKDEQKVQENAKNLVETRDVMPIKLMKPDGRRLNAGIVWMEKSMPLETIRELDGYTALEIAVETIQPKMVKILLTEDRSVYSEKHLGESFRCLMKAIRRPPDEYKIVSNINDIMEVLCYDIQQKMKCKNIKEIASVLMNSSQFNANYQDYTLDTRIHVFM